MRGLQRRTPRGGLPRARWTLPAARSEDGFALLESMVAITLITIVMAALGSFYVRAVGSTNLQRARQVAIQVADSQVDGLRSYPPSDLVSGRDFGTASDQFTNASATVKPWLATMDVAYDRTAAQGAGTSTSLAMPTVPVPLASSPGNNVSYTVEKFLGSCSLPVGASAQDCTNTNTGVPYYRAVVAVSWPSSACTGGTCYYVTATLFTSDPDPAFNLNQLPRPSPVIVSPGNQNSQVGDVISLQLGVRADTGVPTFTWSSSSTFPAGITLSPTGLISGTPTTPASNVSITATVTDGFLQTDTVTFTWTVVPRLAIAPVTTQTSTTGTAITALALSVSGGSGSPYGWSDPQSTLPPGLTINGSTGQITGTPTTPGSYPVQVRVQDSGAAHTTTASWTWNVYAPLVLTNPGDQASIVATPLTPLVMATSGGSGSFTWSLTGTPPTGVSFLAGRFTGTPTVIGGWSVTVTVTDTVLGTIKTAAFNWYVVAPLVISGGNDQVSSVGTAVGGLTLTGSGGAGQPCTWSDPNGTLPPGLTITTVTTSCQGRVAGTPTTPGTYPVQLKVVDSKGVTAWTSFTWTIYPALALANPGARSSTVTTAITALQLSASGGSGSYTWSGGASLPAGLSLSSGGLITGTPTATGTTSVSITVTDTVTTLTKSVAFTWFVAPKPTVTAPANQTTTTTATIPTLQLGGACQNAPCAYTLRNGPAGLSVNATGAITGTVTSGAQTFSSVTVMVTDAAGVSATSGSFSWAVLAVPTVTSPGSQVTTVGATPTPPMTSTCPNSPCSYTINNGPTGLSVTAAGAFTGTVGSPAQTFSSVTVTIRDNAGVTATTAAFSWLVNPALSINSPGNQLSFPNTNVSIDLTTLDFGGTAPFTYSATGLPAWLSITGGVLSGRTPATKTTVTNIVLSVRDAAGVTATSPAFNWAVNSLRLNFGDQVTAPSAVIASGSLDLDTYASGGTAPYSYTFQNKPSWLTYASGTNYLYGTAPATMANYANFVITITDSAGTSVTYAPITWHVDNLKWTTTVPGFSGHVGTPFSNSFAGLFSGGVSPFTYSGSNLPPGIVVNATTGAVSGTPTTAGTYTSCKVTVTDSLGVSVNSNVFTWTIS